MTFFQAGQNDTDQSRPRTPVGLDVPNGQTTAAAVSLKHKKPRDLWGLRVPGTKGQGKDLGAVLVFDISPFAAWH